jgi:hypothetical protein
MIMFICWGKITISYSGRRKENSLPVKIQGACYSFDIAESKYANQIALSHTNVRDERIKLKNCACNKKLLHYFLITM